MAPHSVGACEDAEPSVVRSVTLMLNLVSSTRRGRKFSPKGELQPFGVIENLDYKVNTAVKRLLHQMEVCILSDQDKV